MNTLSRAYYPSVHGSATSCHYFARKFANTEGRLRKYCNAIEQNASVSCIRLIQQSGCFLLVCFSLMWRFDPNPGHWCFVRSPNTLMMIGSRLALGLLTTERTAMTCTMQGGTGFNFDATFIHMHLTRTHLIKSHRPRKSLEDWRRCHNAVMYWLPAIAHLPPC